MTTRADIASHLKLFGELGVQGISRDPIWRERAPATPHAAAPDAPDAGPVADAAATAPEAPLTPPAHLQHPQHPQNPQHLQSLRSEIGDCTRCKLHGLGRRQIVFGVGNPHAELMFVGEAPGADEDVKGEPFVGRAGQLLTKIIEAIQLKREDVYLANVIKCRPPGNRNPEPDEVSTCEPFLAQQIAIIRPKVIVALGTFAAHLLLKTDVPISRLRGRVHELPGGTKLVPTFHPAFLLRSPERKRDVWEDMKIVRAFLSHQDA